MPGKKKWVAALAASGTTVGAVVALSNAPAAVSSSPAAASADRGRTIAHVDAETAQLDAAVAQVYQLQSRIADLRKELRADESVRLPTSASAYVPGSGAEPSNSPISNSPAALIAGEASRLRAEQAALTSERNALAQGAAQLQAEEEQFVQAERRAASTASTAPTTHTSTGASGSGGADN
jgi:peptidoglycan hydrolase CwlO-like protein